MLRAGWALLAGLAVAGALLVSPSVGIRASGAAPAPSGPNIHDPFRAVAIPGRDLVLVAESYRYPGSPDGTWALDLHDRDWRRVASTPLTDGPIGLLGFIPQLDAVYSVPGSPGAVAVLDMDDPVWRELPIPSVRPVTVTDMAVDTRRGRIIAWSDQGDELWTYRPGSNRWVQVRRAPSWPSAAIPDGQPGYTQLTYDQRADRAVLAVFPLPMRPGATWLWDPERGTWTQRASPPALVFGYGEYGVESVYDSVHLRTVAFANGTIATYDSARDRWTVPSNDRWPGLTFDQGFGTIGPFDGQDPWPEGLPIGVLARSDHVLTLDPLHGRVILMGGAARFRTPGSPDGYEIQWLPVTSLWAYDVGFNSWTLMSD